MSILAEDAYRLSQAVDTLALTFGMNAPLNTAEDVIKTDKVSRTLTEAQMALVKASNLLKDMNL